MAMKLLLCQRGAASLSLSGSLRLAAGTCANNRSSRNLISAQTHRRNESNQRIIVKWSSATSEYKAPKSDVNGEYKRLGYESQIKKKADEFKRLIDNVMITLSYEKNLAEDLKLKQQQAALQIVNSLDQAIPLSSAKICDILTSDYLISGFSEERGHKTVGKYLLTPEDVDEKKAEEDSTPAMAAESKWNKIFINPNFYDDYPEKFADIGRAFERFLRSNCLPTKTVNDHHFEKWNWFRIQMRRNNKREHMAIVSFHPQALSEEEITKNKEQLKDFFLNQSGLDLSSLYFQKLSTKHPDLITKDSFQALYGSPVLSSDIGGLDFVYHPCVLYPVVHETFQKVNTNLARMLQQAQNDVIIQIDAVNGGILGVLCRGAYKKYYSIERSSHSANNTQENFRLHNLHGESCRTLVDLSKLPGFMKMIAHENGPDARMSLVFNCDNQYLISYKRNSKNDFLLKLRETAQIKTVLYLSNSRMHSNVERDVFNLMAPKSRSSGLFGQPFVATEAVVVDERPDCNQAAILVRFDRD